MLNGPLVRQVSEQHRRRQAILFDAQRWLLGRVLAQELHICAQVTLEQRSSAANCGFLTGCRAVTLVLDSVDGFGTLTSRFPLRS